VLRLKDTFYRFLVSFRQKTNFADAFKLKELRILSQPFSYYYYIVKELKYIVKELKHMGRPMYFSSSAHLFK